jgi:hypothetical protein
MRYPSNGWTLLIAFFCILLNLEIAIADVNSSNFSQESDVFQTDSLSYRYEGRIEQNF